MAKLKANIGIREYIRALRLPFITASILPFILGSCISKQEFGIFPFILGLLCVGFTHLGANLINDYADSKSGADWQDKNWYTFFGGSKLIQEGILPEKFYLNTAIFCFMAALVCILIVSAVLQNILMIVFYILILFLGSSYSHKPFRFSYHRLGEFIIFILFGPAVVMGGYFIQTQIFPDLKAFMLSLPFGFFTTAILYSNEIPDFQDDIKAGKLTWVSIVGQRRGFILYYGLILLGFFSIGVNIMNGFLGTFSYIAFLFLIPALKAARILKVFSNDKLKLIESSRLTIAVQTLVSIVLIVDKLL